MLNILVTGAGGQLGSELRLLGAASGNNWIYTDSDELDITDASAVRHFAESSEAHVIVNCAGYTDVEAAEDDEESAYAANCTAVKNLALAAAERGAVLIHFSTDYVFDGKSACPYTEDMPACPLSAYGRTKLAGEKAVEESGCRHLIFRTAWLYSEYGRNFLKKMLELTAGRPELQVVSDQTGSPTYAADLAQAVFRIIESGKFALHQGIFHYAGAGSCSWYEFACAIAAEAGQRTCAIHPCRTGEYPSKAPRPAYSVLDTGKYRRTFGDDVPHWSEAMKRCIAKIKENERK